LTRVVQAALPEEYENRKHWGGTTEATIGVSLRRDGHRLQLRPRQKTVNHGTWKYYRVRLKSPDQSLRIELANIRQSPEGHVRFDLVAVADVEVFGRFSDWRYGIQLFSISALADARVRLTAECDVAMIIDPTRVPPDVELRPHVNQARLDLEHFELERLSQLHGDVAHELGKGVREILEEVLEEKRDKLVEKMNRQIERNQDHLRLSLRDAASGVWQKVSAAPQDASKDGAAPATAAVP
jgi:hypothetical protein